MFSKFFCEFGWRGVPDAGQNLGAEATYLILLGDWSSTIDADGPGLDASNLNSKALRYYTSKELPLHSETAPENQLYKVFEMSTDVESMTSCYFEDFNNNLDEKIAEGDSLCPEGWRVPNQLEIAMAYHYAAQTQGTFCRTYFSFGPWGSNKESSKYGFEVSGNINVAHQTRDTYRCVRDVRVD